MHKQLGNRLEQHVLHPENNKENYDEYSFDEDTPDGAGEMDVTAGVFGFTKRVMHFLCGKIISSATRPVVKLVIVMKTEIHIHDRAFILLRNPFCMPKSLFCDQFWDILQ